MKLIIAGSRDIVDSVAEGYVSEFIGDYEISITEVVSGGARGVDTMGEKWASNFNILVKQFIPDWDTHGKAAGMIRNRQMADYADGLLAIWDGESRGTKNMIEEALKRNLKLWVVTV